MARIIAKDEPVLMDPKETRLFTVLIEKDGALVSAWGKQTVEEIKEEYPKLEQLTFDVAIALIDKNLKERYEVEFGNLWEEIPENIWWEHLECLPPEAWGNVTLPNGDKYEMFRMSEYVEGEYTQHFACTGEQYFSKVCSIARPMEDHAKELWNDIQQGAVNFQQDLI